METEEYSCQSVAIKKYAHVPRTFADFLDHVNNPEEVKSLFTKLKLTVIYFINYGHTRFGEYFYYPDVKTLFNQIECAVRLDHDSVDYQHVFVLRRNEADLLNSELQLLVSPPSSRPILRPEVVTTPEDYDDFNRLADEFKRI